MMKMMMMMPNMMMMMKMMMMMMKMMTMIMKMMMMIVSRRKLCCKNLKFDVSTPSLGSSSGDVRSLEIF